MCGEATHEKAHLGSITACQGMLHASQIGILVSTVMKTQPRAALPFLTFGLLCIDTRHGYPDGSSKSSNRRDAPLKVAEQDQLDAWAYIVPGESMPRQAGQAM